MAPVMLTELLSDPKLPFDVAKTLIVALTCGMVMTATCVFCAVQPNKVAAYMRHKRLSSRR